MINLIWKIFWLLVTAMLFYCIFVSLPGILHLGKIGLVLYSWFLTLGWFGGFISMINIDPRPKQMKFRRYRITD